MASTSASERSDACIIEEKDKEIDKIVNMVEIIIQTLGPVISENIRQDFSNGIIDVDLSNELSRFLRAVFTCLRKEENDNAGHVKYMAYSTKIAGVDVTVLSVIEKIKATGIKLNFPVATPIVHLMTLFEAFFSEVRTGVGRFKVRSSIAKKSIKRDSSGRPIADDLDSRDCIQSISQYGLNSNHLPLLQGITLDPKLRTEVVRSVGPMTQAIILLMGDEYNNEISKALFNSLQMLPMAQEIINCLKHANTPGPVIGILNELGNILLMTTVRTTEIYFPLLLITYMWQRKPPSISWSFSGALMMQYYTMLVADGLKFRMKTGADCIKASEVIFHAMFGSYLEDLSILSYTTDHAAKWSQRKDLNSVFHERASQNALEIVPIKFKYVRIKAQSLGNIQMNRVNFGGGQIVSRPVFAGFRTRVFSQEFFNYFSGEVSPVYSNDPVHLISELRKTKNLLLEKKDEMKKTPDAGTKEWEEFVNGKWVPSSFVPVDGNYKFYGW